MGKPLTEQQFNTITAQLRKKSNDIATVAEASGLKVSTVKVIRRAQTWQHYQAYRKAEGAKIKALHKLDKITKDQPSVKVPAMAGDVTVRAKKPSTTPVNKLAVFEKLLMAQKRVNAENAQRIEALETAVSDIQNNEIVSDIQDRRTFMARFRRGQR
ncbi:hypothetical protein AB4Y95_00320 [Arthrobacter sp. M-10]|uniref:hypothetical protein n=1 Tax=Arthrobacter sp. M-10 TaxID=3233037 RepID=UPI003F8ED201